MKRIAQIAVPINLNKTFSYLIPDELINDVEVGKRVLVPFTNRKVTGYVVKAGGDATLGGLKKILRVLDETPLFSIDDLKLFTWLSSYYVTPLANVIKTALPSGIDKQTKKFYMLTDAGRDYIEKRSGKSADILKAVKQKEPVSAALLKRRFDSPAIAATLRRLVKNGLLTEKEVLKEGELKRRFTKFVTVSAENRGFFIDYIASLTKNATKMRVVCAYLIDKGDVEYAVLTKKFGNVKKITDGLARNRFISLEQREKEVSFASGLADHDKQIRFTAEQKRAQKEINAALDSSEYRPFLLHGVTSSGKTELYIEAAKHAVMSGKGVIILVPEIALTPHYIKRFNRHFKEIAVMHSAISPRDKHHYYLKILNGEIKVVIGARSAIFAPVKDPGLFIVDEEHVSTYKQDDGFMYNARDVALVKAKMKSCTVILGSATPTLESYHNAVTGRYNHLKLTKRANKMPLPKLRVVDMRDEKVDGDKKSMIISKTLKSAIERNLKKGKQTMLFLNRRGHSSCVVCYDCGESATCPNCSIALTYHRTDNTLVCHYCGFKKPLNGLCGSCKSSRVRPVGFGTQRVSEIVRGYFSDARVFRIDSDTMTKNSAYVDFYKMMDAGEIDIVVGTQMIAKGHDFENVTLVGILNADAGLNMPDFRAEEKCFSQIMQVSGRAGRGDTPGEVIVQTLNPENDYISYAVNAESDKFYEKELKLRRALNYPPFMRMASIRIVARVETHGRDAYISLERIAKRAAAGRKYKGVSIMGPVECPIHKIKNRYRWQMLARAHDSKLLHLFICEVKGRLKRTVNAGYVKINIDVDPINML